MSLSTTQYGFIIDPMVPFTDASGTTIRNGYVRVFVAGSSTPVITYKNYDGATNEETIQLDNSGRTAYPVIVSKGNTFKVCVYDAEHSQESPILTIDKVVPAGANVEATNIVTGLDNVESPEAGWVKSTVSGTDAEVSLDATNVTSEVDTMVKATAASADYMMPLVHKTGSDPDKKITLGNIFKFVLNFIHSLTDTATESDIASGNYFALDGSAGTKKLNSTTLLTKTAQNALAGNVAPEFVPNETNAIAGMPYVYGGQLYIARENYNGIWKASKFEKTSFEYLLKTRCPFSLSSADFKSYKGFPSGDNATWYVSQYGRHIAIPLLYGFNYVVKCNTDQERFFAAILDSSYVIGDAASVNVPYASHWSGRLYKLVDTAVIFSKEYADDCYLVLPVENALGTPIDYTISVSVKATDEIEKECEKIIDASDPLSSVLSSNLTSYPGSIGASGWFNDPTTHPAHVYLKLKPNRVYAVKSLASNTGAFFIGILSAKNTVANIEAGSGTIEYSSNHPERIIVSDLYLFRTTSDGEDAYLAVTVVSGGGTPSGCTVFEFYTEFSALAYLNRPSEVVDRFSTTTKFEAVATASASTKIVQVGRTIKAGSNVVAVIKGSLDVSSLASIYCNTASAFCSRGQIAFTASTDLTSISFTFQQGFAASGTLYVHVFVNHECDVSSFRVATLNIGCMSGGDYPQPTRTEEEAAAYIAKIQTMMSAVSPDIICMQEFSLNVWDGGPNDSWKIWKNYLSFGSYGTSGYAPKFIASMLPFALPLTVVTLDANSRNYVYMELNIHGRSVKVVSLHLTTDDSEVQQQIATVINDFKDDKYVILCGDYNVQRNYDYYNALTYAGYALANGDAFPKVYTGNRPDSDRYNDNIAVKGMRIRAVGLYSDADISDHKMMYADINFFDTGD